MKRLMSGILILVFLISTAGCTGISSSDGQKTSTLPAPGSSPETSLQIKEYVDAAAAWAQENGRDAALKGFQDTSGPFVTGGTCIFARDFSGTVLALPFQPEMVGTKYAPFADASGTPRTNAETILAGNGGGYILSYYQYPTRGQPVTLKLCYVRPVDETYWIGACVNTSEEFLITPQLRQFVDNAKTYARENGRDAALAEFNDVNGSFVSGDLYIFAYDYNGSVLSWPYQPLQVGINRLNATDIVGSHHVQAFLDKAKNGGGMVDYYSPNPFTNRTDLKISYVTDVDGTWMLGAGRYIEPGDMLLHT